MDIRGKRGVTLMILLVTLVIILIISTTVIVSINGFGKLNELEKLINDLKILQAKVDIFYESYDTLPLLNQIQTNVKDELGVDNINANDGDDYYKLGLYYFDDVNLSFGHERVDKDYFIINELSHNIYYYAGITDGDKTYYGLKKILSDIDNIDFEVYDLKTDVKVQAVEGRLEYRVEVQNLVLTDNPNIDIVGYRFKIDNQEWSQEQYIETYTFTNLVPYSEHIVSVKVIDNEYNETYVRKKVIVQKETINSTIDGKLQGTYNNPIIPAGFKPINENDAIWQSSDGYKNGLVIEDNSGNQFVWIPVDGTIINFEKFDFLNNSTDLTGYIETMPIELETSVTNYGGFYIARYEAGNVENVLVSKGDQNIWVTTNIDAINKAESMYSGINYGVTSTLVYGTQWDATLKFIEAYNGDTDYAIDSVDNGNYSGTVATSGLQETFRKKNIYDMAGNGSEWTMEKDEVTNNNVIRGGYYGSPSSERFAGYRIASTAETSTFRVALYIENIEVVEDIPETNWSTTELVNMPRLVMGMIPIKYSGGNWVITNSTDPDWYEYNVVDRNWANVMLSDGAYKVDSVTGNVVDSLNGNAIVDTDGTEIVSESSLGSMFVWIPRYEYKITYYTNSDRVTATTGNAFSLHGIIDVNFIPKETLTPNTGYTIHPVFRNGSMTNYENGEWKSEIDGFWFAKFEASNNSDLRYIASPTNADYVTSLPNKAGWSGVSIENAFNYCKRMTTINASDYGITAGAISVDSHLVKNSEWGAVAYLAFSEYGRNQVAPNLNNYMSGAPRTTRTGIGGSSTSVSVSNSYGTNIYTSANGLLANTTGNITGIYDMAGGLNEHIASFYTGKSLSSYSENSEYTMVYTDTDIANGKVGDATRETAEWHGDSAVTITDYFLRGGAPSNATSAGFFNFQNVNGEGGSGSGSPDYRGFRPAIIVE